MQIRIPTTFTFPTNSLTCLCCYSIRPIIPFFFLMFRPPPRSTLFPYPTLFRSDVALEGKAGSDASHGRVGQDGDIQATRLVVAAEGGGHLGHLHERKDAFLHASAAAGAADRSEEHTSELQSPCNLVCRLLLEKK